MGAHEKEERSINLTVRLSKTELKEIEDLAEYLEIPHTVFARNAILFGVDEAKGMKRLGFLAVAKKIKKSYEFLEKFKEGQEKKQLSLSY